MKSTNNFFYFFQQFRLIYGSISSLRVTTAEKSLHLPEIISKFVLNVNSYQNGKSFLELVWKQKNVLFSFKIVTKSFWRTSVLTGGKNSSFAVGYERSIFLDCVTILFIALRECFAVRLLESTLRFPPNFKLEISWKIKKSQDRWKWIFKLCKHVLKMKVDHSPSTIRPVGKFTQRGRGSFGTSRFVYFVEHQMSMIFSQISHLWQKFRSLSELFSLSVIITEFGFEKYQPRNSWHFYQLQKLSLTVFGVIFELFEVRENWKVKFITPKKLKFLVTTTSVAVCGRIWVCKFDDKPIYSFTERSFWPLNQYILIKKSS